MSTSTITLPVHEPRRISDPNFPGCAMYELLVKAGSLQRISLDPNPRTPKIDRAMYRKIGGSLMQAEDSPHTAGAFHLRHRGLAIVANSITIEQKSGLDDVTIEFIDGTHGMVDGGHSQEIVLDKIAAALEDEDGQPVPENEWIMLQVMTGYSPDVIVEIAEGRNTSMQVKRASLMNLAQSFDFIKEALGERQEHVVWAEGDDGSISAEKVAAMIGCFDLYEYPDRSRHPVLMYLKSTLVLDLIATEPAEDEDGVLRPNRDRLVRVSPIISDIFELYHYIEATGPKLWAGKDPGASYGRSGGISIFTAPKKTTYQVPVVEIVTDQSVRYGPALIMLAAFRHFVEPDPDAEPISGLQPLRWKVPFHHVKAAWDEHGPDMMRRAVKYVDEAGRDATVNSVCRQSTVWESVSDGLLLGVSSS